MGLSWFQIYLCVVIAFFISNIVCIYRNKDEIKNSIVSEIGILTYERSKLLVTFVIFVTLIISSIFWPLVCLFLIFRKITKV